MSDTFDLFLFLKKNPFFSFLGCWSSLSSMSPVLAAFSAILRRSLSSFFFFLYSYNKHTRHRHTSRRDSAQRE